MNVAVSFDSSVPSPSPPSPFKRSRFGRGKRTPIARWFWEIDRVLLLLVTILIGVGLIAVAAASPAAGVRYSGTGVTVAPRHYFWMQLGWTVIAVPVMLAVSALPVQIARRGALIGGILFLTLLALVPIVGSTANGATRWISLGPAKLQPSEFLKPMFAVGMAWLFSLRARNPGLPFAMISVVPMALVAVLLMKQPDFGQTVIFVSVWIVLLMLSGASLKLLGMLGAGGLAAIVSAYFFYSVATERINKFLFKQGDTYQVDRAHATLTNGGLLGTGPGAGTEKFTLPEPHTDYIFSVIGEEFGLIACIAIACLYLAIVARVSLRLLREENDFLLLASAGLVSQFGLQALINMMVNVGLAPSKGMTLPFISYGGSSMIALSIGMGLLLAFTRENPHLKEATYTVRWNGR
ncbi:MULTISPECIES: FtsW/RodA/SpoVE family cell cycle protein [unclassified Sphingomonas]|uniref:FtsW/RodA/SpoVE family cell cycle protein n=1 Tax=unclassified Sphingomonas TaxID=196159 RepID=UPI0006F3763C|nr:MULTISPECIES: putative peptidoglycan glycosyltransferase FtsW [unclassified Sphingomonas]KQX17831.1 cell division protein FtsW [Sphingomonas sp. Root1294]KQY70757.1 cell division protein FtsW [Sphingomonas sp. Root50]KRB91749.1 cell division protein FtsW [Sphingomonas sp. Root720]